MKLIVFTLTFLFSLSSLLAQQLPVWDRVYTFDDSIIEMNTSDLIIGGNIARATFRWTFDQPEILSGHPQQTYKSRHEVFEFNCIDKRYRPYEITFVDAAGKLTRTEVGNPPPKWFAIIPGSMIEKLFTPACQLFNERTLLAPPSEAIELQNIYRYLLSFSQRLEQAKDFKPLIESFFAADYLDRFLRDKQTNWFFNLNRETAAKASRAELQRFYVALLNTGYLSCVFFVSQAPYADRDIPEEKLVPAEVLQLVENHPYSARYKGRSDNYDYLAETIDSVERLREYTDLLERISTLMRRRVINAHSLGSREYQDISGDFDLYQIESQVCAAECLGLPKGTKLFAAKLPLFHLQLAMIKGQLKIVSATDYSH